MTKNVIYTVMLTQDTVQPNHHVYISSDKGNKKGNKNFAKFICWFDCENNEIKILISVGCTDEDTSGITDTVHHSLTIITPPRS